MHDRNFLSGPGNFRDAECNRTATARAKKLLDSVPDLTGWLLEKLCLGKKIRPGLSLNLKISDARRVALI